MLLTVVEIYHFFQVQILKKLLLTLFNKICNSDHIFTQNSILYRVGSTITDVPWDLHIIQWKIYYYEFRLGSWLSSNSLLSKAQSLFQLLTISLHWIITICHFQWVLLHFT